MAKKSASPRRVSRPAPTKTTAVPRQLPVVPTRLSEMTLPTREEEARLLQAALGIETLKPWQKLNETEIFVVENPETGERGFISVLGAMGTNFSVLVYRGEGAYFQLQSFLETADDEDANPFDLLKISQLQLAFDPKDALEKWDKELLRRHQIPLRGRPLFPKFHSLCIGYLPWRIDGAEARFLTVALEQLSELLARPDFSNAQLKVKTAVKNRQPRHTFFARVPRRENDATTTDWRDERLTIEPPAPFMVELPDCDALLEQIDAKPEANEVWEIDFDSVPLPLAPPDERPYFPEIVLLGCNGMILAQVTTTQGFWAGALPEMMQLVLDLLASQPKRPRELWFSDVRLMSVMHLLHSETGIEVKPQESLPSLDDAFESFFDFMQTPLPAGLDMFPFEAPPTGKMH